MRLFGHPIAKNTGKCRFGFFSISFLELGFGPAYRRGALFAFLCLSLSTAAFLSLKKTKADTEALSLVSQAISLIYAGYESDALEVLNKAKTVSGGKLSVPYLLSANIYINMQQYARAKGEYEVYQKTSGKNDSAFKKMVSIKIEKIEKKAVPAKADSPDSPRGRGRHGSAARPASTRAGKREGQWRRNGRLP